MRNPLNSGGIAMKLKKIPIAALLSEDVEPRFGNPDEISLSTTEARLEQNATIRSLTSSCPWNTKHFHEALRLHASAGVGKRWRDHPPATIVKTRVS